MKATEQLSSLEMMAVDPLKRVIAPRFWAGAISMPLLAMIFMAVGIWGAQRNALLSIRQVATWVVIGQTNTNLLQVRTHLISQRVNEAIVVESNARQELDILRIAGFE